MEIVVTPQAEGLQLVECFRWNIIYTGTVTHSSKTTERNIRLDLLRDMFCTLCFLCQWSWDPAVEVSYILEPETELLHLLWSYSHSHPELWRTHTCTQAHRLTLRSAHAWVQFTAEYSQKEQFASWVCVCVFMYCVPDTRRVFTDAVQCQVSDPRTGAAGQTLKFNTVLQQSVHCGICDLLQCKQMLGGHSKVKPFFWAYKPSQLTEHFWILCQFFNSPPGVQSDLVKWDVWVVMSSPWDCVHWLWAPVRY